MRKFSLIFSLTIALSAEAQFNTIGLVPQPPKTKTEPTELVVDSVKPIAAQQLIYFHPPLKGILRVTSPFGLRKNPFDTAGHEYHNGLDLSAASGTPVYAMLAGVVEAVGYDHRSGNFIKLRHGNFTVAYCHLLRKPSLETGTKVSAGAMVGFVGNTGRSTGSHLHITFRHNGMTINPELLLRYFLAPVSEPDS